MQTPSRPRGIRFAPSPTGVFHIGNLRTAWVSERLARENGEPWVVRFDDIDTPRVMKGAQEQQLADFTALEMRPDAVVLQSARAEQIRGWFDRARLEGVIYPCSCSRKEVQEELARMASAPHQAPAVYSGHCRQTPASGDGVVGWRFRSQAADGSQDFVIGRATLGGAEFQPAYHWACALDDWEGRYRCIVRAIDLAPAWEFQRSIMEWCERVAPGGGVIPSVFHTRMVVAADGSRLEKRTRGVALGEWSAGPRGLVRAFAASGTWVLPAQGQVGAEPEVERPLSVGELAALIAPAARG